MKAYVRIVRDIHYHDIVSSGILEYQFRDQGPQKWTTQAIQILKVATKMYMVMVVAKSFF